MAGKDVHSEMTAYDAAPCRVEPLAKLRGDERGDVKLCAAVRESLLCTLYGLLLHLFGDSGTGNENPAISHGE